MFARLVTRGPTRFLAAKKNFGTANPTVSSSATTSHKGKNFKQAWLSDSGAYPVMGVIVFAVAFCSGTMAWLVSAHPDSRVSKSARKSIFRGELKGEN